MFLEGCTDSVWTDARAANWFSVRLLATHRFPRMLGYRTAFLDRMVRVNRHFHARNFSALRLFLLTALFALFSSSSAFGARPQLIHLPSGKGGIAELSSTGPQRRQGDLYIADGDVDIRYGELRLRADHIEYNNKTSESVARGHVQFDYENQHLEADEADFNVSTGRGLFRNVRGTVKIERRPNPSLLVSENPLYFEAHEVERLPGDVYLVHEAWITVCDPEHPKW